MNRFGGRLAGVGGFVDIYQTAKKVVFLSTFTAGGLETSCEDSKLPADDGIWLHDPDTAAPNLPSIATTESTGGGRSASGAGDAAHCVG